MSKIVLKVAQAIGILVLALLVLGVVVGLVQWVVVAAVIVAVPVGCWWLYRRMSGRAASKRPALQESRMVVTGSPAHRRAELESRAMIDSAGRCGWCGSATLHRDRFGFPATPLTYHRKEIEAML